MILHLFIDDKFIDYAITHFEEVAPSQNTFIVIVPSQDYVLKYIQQKEKVKLVVDSDENVNNLMSELFQYDAVIFHSLFSLFFLKILYFSNPNKIKLVWIFWGGEFFNHPLIVNKYIGKLTSITFFLPLRGILNKGKIVIRGIVKKDKYSIIKNCRKISHITALEEDYINIQRKWNIHAKLMQNKYTYYSIEKTIGSLMSEYVSGNNVLVGNSADITNNHLEIFQILKKIDLKGRKIIVPLSYSVNIKYRDRIIKRGRQLWGDDFVPLTTFMEKEKYNLCILDCNIVIMNHYRQQAVGNVITALWLGAKLFLSEKSPVYKYFKDMGLIIYTVENDLCPKNHGVFTPLTLEEINWNRNILYEQYSSLNIIKNTDLFLKELSN